MEHFGAVFKLDLTEETKTQLQEEEAVASSCLTLAMPMLTLLVRQSACRTVNFSPAICQPLRTWHDVELLKMATHSYTLIDQPL